jgi:uncharacterized membrane protein (UPF0182 family)
MAYFRNIQTLTTDQFDMKTCLRENTQLQSIRFYLFIDLTVDKMLRRKQKYKIEVSGRFEL